MMVYMRISSWYFYYFIIIIIYKFILKDLHYKRKDDKNTERHRKKSFNKPCVKEKEKKTNLFSK